MPRKERMIGQDSTARPLTYVQFVNDYRDADLFGQVAEEVGVEYFVTRDPDEGAGLVRAAAEILNSREETREREVNPEDPASYAREKVKMGGAVIKLTANPGEDFSEFWRRYHATKEQQRAAHQQSADDLELR